MKFMGSLFAVLVVVGFVVGNQDDVKSERPVDKDLLIKVASCDHAATQVSKLADRRAESSQVKDFATMVVKEHKDTGDKLAELLKGRNLAVAAGFDKETKDEIKRLSSLDGKAFDRAYIQCMVKGHKEAIAILENQVKNGKEEDISAFAKQVLPNMRKHLTMANDLAKTVE